MTAVAILGLGVMGAALARAQQAAGNEVVAWNRTAGRAPDLAVRREPELARAVSDAHVVLACLLDDRATAEVLAPIASELRGRIVVNLATKTPADARARAAWAAAHGIAYLDGGIMAVPPMIGTPAALLLLAGHRTTFAEAEPVLSVFGRAAYVGEEPGRAALVDTALLVAMYGLFGGWLQAAVMAGSGGMTATELAAFAVPWLGAMTSALPAMATQIDARRFGDDVGSSLAMQANGIRMLVEASQAAGADPALTRVVERWLRAAVDAGHGAEDLGRLVDIIRVAPAIEAVGGLASGTGVASGGDRARLHR